MRDHQQSYYDALASSDRQADSTNFITFMLETIEQVLQENVSLNAPVNVPVNLKDLKTTDAVMTCIRQDAGMTRKEIAQKVWKDVRTVARALRKLQDGGLPERVGSDKAGSWRVTGK